MFKYNLFLNYYIDKNEERQNELNFCFLENILNKSISKFVILCDDSALIEFKSKFGGLIDNRFQFVILSERPTYNTFFEATRVYGIESYNINIIANSDIIFDDHILLCEKYVDDYVCLALSRWDATSLMYYKDCSLFDRADSQDTWVFKGGVDFRINANFSMGIAGCDNSIAHILSESIYEVKNPSKTIKTYHLHLTNVRNYIDDNTIQRIPPPYRLIAPTE